MTHKSILQKVMTEILIKQISGKLSISKLQISKTVKLLEEGATIPFISRYRKEATGSLDETKVRAIENELRRLLELVKRRESILKSVNDQELLTPELEDNINNCWAPSGRSASRTCRRPKG